MKSLTMPSAVRTFAVFSATLLVLVAAISLPSCSRSKTTTIHVVVPSSLTGLFQIDGPSKRPGINTAERSNPSDVRSFAAFRTRGRCSSNGQQPPAAQATKKVSTSAPSTPPS